MSQADALLASLNDEDMAVYSAETKVEEHIIIGNDRFITVPEKLKRIAVEHDHDIETVTFDCPRYWDNNDMSEMIVYINYMLPDGTKDAYIAKNITVDGDIMHFDWTIGNNMTQNKGNISFLVCIVKTDTEGNEERHWNSELNRDLYISEGLEVVPSVVMDYPDIVTQLLERMTSVEENSVTAAEVHTHAINAISSEQSAWEALAYVEENRSAVENMVTTLGNSFANPIKRTARGEIVRVDDVSPVEHTAHVIVRGKNLLPYPYLNNDKTADGVTFASQPDGGIALSGTPTSVFIGMSLYKGIALASAGYVTFSLLGDFTGVYARMDICDEAGNKLYTGSGYSNSITVNLDEYPTAASWDVFIRSREDLSEFSGVVYPQIEIGEMTTSYEPYIDPSTVTLNACGKNMIPYPYVESTLTRAGVTFTVNENGTIVADGTSNGAYMLINRTLDTNLYLHAGVAYRFYGVPAGGGYETYYAYVAEEGGNTYFDLGEGVTFTATKDCYASITIVVKTGMTVSNLEFAPMLEVGNEATGWEAYKGTTYTPATDDTVDISAIYPTMTLYTDANVNIEVEYNVDSNVYLQELKDLINAGGSRFNTNLTDTVTGEVYAMSIANGKLTLTKLEV